MMCALPHGDCSLTSPVAMWNLLGDVWANGEPDWQAGIPAHGHLHLYGKAEARTGRKMGHINVLGEDAITARHDALAIKQRLTPNT